MDSKRIRLGHDLSIGAWPVFVGASEVPADVRLREASRLLPADVPRGGAAVPAARMADLMADLAARAREAWLESGGSRARFEAGVRHGLGRGEGGRRILAALSLASFLQAAAVPAAALADYEVQPGQTVSSVRICGSSGHVGSGCADWRMIVLAGAQAHGTVVSSGGSQYLSSGGVATGTVLGSKGLQMVYRRGVASGTVVEEGGVASRPYPRRGQGDRGQLRGEAIRRAPRRSVGDRGPLGGVAVGLLRRRCQGDRGPLGGGADRLLGRRGQGDRGLPGRGVAGPLRRRSLGER